MKLLRRSAFLLVLVAVGWTGCQGQQHPLRHSPPALLRTALDPPPANLPMLKDVPLPPLRHAATGKRLPRTVRYRLTSINDALDVDETAIVNNKGDLLVSGDVWRGGRKETLPNTLKDKEYRTVEAVGMNNSGVVTGNISGQEDGAYLVEFSQAVKWRRGHMTALPPFKNLETVAAGINNRGEIVGYGFEQTNDALADTTRAFVFRRGRMQDIGRGGAVGINDRGQVLVQWSDPSAFRLYAKDAGQDIGTSDSSTYVWDNGSRRHIAIPKGYGDFDTFAGFNNHGAFAGSISTGSLSRYGGGPTHRAFVCRGGKTRVLGTLGGESSQALGINNQGQVVGAADAGPPDAHGDENTHAFLWKNGHLQDLNRLISARSGWTLYSANGINDRGKIVCAGNKGVCLLTPVTARMH